MEVKKHLIWLSLFMVSTSSLSATNCSDLMGELESSPAVSTSGCTITSLTNADHTSLGCDIVLQCNGQSLSLDHISQRYIDTVRYKAQETIPAHLEYD